jgi:hypothetical protein
MAVSNGSADLVKYLVEERKADINAVDKVNYLINRKVWIYPFKVINIILNKRAKKKLI